MPKPSATSDLARLREGRPPVPSSRPARNATAVATLSGTAIPTTRQRRATTRDMRSLLEDEAVVSDTTGGSNQHSTREGPGSGKSDSGDEWGELRAALPPLIAKIASGQLQGDAAVDALVQAVSDVAEVVDDDSDYEDDQPGDSDTGNMDATESEQLVTLRRQRRATELLESVGAPATTANIRTVAAIPERDKRRELAKKLAAKNRRG
jgi:hypothetical protein